MKRMKLYTENKNTEKLIELISESLDAGTIYFGKGMWKGNLEDSLIVECIVDDVDVETVKGILKKLAEEIKKMNNQECVMITTENLEKVEFV